MTIRTDALRCTIPQSVHGLGSSAELRGMAMFGGDLYMYLWDSDVASFKKAVINSTEDEYVVQASDFLTWDFPINANVLESSGSPGTRVFPGLYIFENHVLLFYPDENGNTRIAVAPFEGGKQNIDAELVKAIPSQPIYEADRISYGGLQAIRPTEVDTDNLSIRFIYASKLSGETPRLEWSIYSSSLHVYYQSEPYSMELPSGENLVKGILQVLNHNEVVKYAYLTGNSPKTARLFRFAPTGFALESSINWSFGQFFDDYLFFTELGDVHDQIFYLAAFNSNNDIEVYKYQDRATMKSSSNSLITVSKDVVQYMTSTPNKITAKFIDAFGQNLYEGLPVYVGIVTSSPPDEGSLAISEGGPFFDEAGNPLNKYLWLTTDENGEVIFFYLSPRSFGTPTYTEKLLIVAGFENVDDIQFGDLVSP